MEVDSQQTAWNMAGLLIQEIAGLFHTATENYTSGNLDKWYFSLKAVKLRAFNVITKPERETLAKLEVAIQKDIGYITSNFTDTSIKVQAYTIIKRQTVIKKIEEYSESLSDILGKHGLLLVPKEDSRHI